MMDDKISILFLQVSNIVGYSSLVCVLKFPNSMISPIVENLMILSCNGRYGDSPKGTDLKLAGGK